MSNELLVICTNPQLSADLYSALGTDFSLRDSQAHVPDIEKLNSISPLLLLIEADLFDSDHERIISYFGAGYKGLVYGADWSDSKQIRAYTEGMSGYCSENVKPIVLQEAVKSILKGDIWIKQHLISTVINSLLQRKQEDTRKKDLENNISELLSDRELDVVRRVQMGESNRDIADKLCISERTVKAHLSSTFKKLNVPDRLHLVVLLQQLNI